MNSVDTNSADTKTMTMVDVFRRDGFVVVPGLFDAEEARQISAWTDEVQAQPEPPAAP